MSDHVIIIIIMIIIIIIMTDYSGATSHMETPASRGMHVVTVGMNQLKK